MGPARKLAAHLSGNASVGVVCHDDPDPDCLASAFALGAAVRWCGASSVAYYDGSHLTHPQNESLVDYLDMEIRPLPDPELDRVDVLALVDHAVPGDHDSLAPGTTPTVVVDHHEYDRPVEGEFVDLRPDYGATATILVEYLRELGVPISTPVATGLLFALHRERLDSIRHPTHHEYEAAARLFPLSDRAAIDRLYRSGKTPAIIDATAAAIRNRQVSESCLVSWVGDAPGHTALPLAAEYLLTLQQVDTVLVFGLVDGDVHLSARSTDARVDLGRLLPLVVGSRGQAGGHRDMAGGVIPVPDVEEVSDYPVDVQQLVDAIEARFCSAVAAATSAVDRVSGPPEDSTRPPHADSGRPTSEEGGSAGGGDDGRGASLSPDWEGATLSRGTSSEQVGSTWRHDSDPAWRGDH